MALPRGASRPAACGHPGAPVPAALGVWCEVERGDEPFAGAHRVSQSAVPRDRADAAEMLAATARECSAEPPKRAPSVGGSLDEEVRVVLPGEPDAAEGLDATRGTPSSGSRRWQPSPWRRRRPGRACPR